MASQAGSTMIAHWCRRHVDLCRTASGMCSS
ncbi:MULTISPECIES: putative leader peptide [Rhodococcus]